MREYIIKDSSFKRGDGIVNLEKDYSIRVGVVKEHIFVEQDRQTRYIVEVWKNNRIYPVSCIRTSRFGGLYNYEEYNLRGYKNSDNNAFVGCLPLTPGDMVIIAASNGVFKDGIILGHINHFGRDEQLPATGDIAFINEFNGISQVINKYGEYRRTFKGLPSNLDELDKVPDGNYYPSPEYDEDVGFSYYEFDSTGSYTVTDNANDMLPQTIRIDKSKGTISIVSGMTSFVIDKKKQSYTIKNDTTTFNTKTKYWVKTEHTLYDSTTDWELNTQVMRVMAQNLIRASASKIETFGKWRQTGEVNIIGDTSVKGDATVSGSFSNNGSASLAGGAHPLIYDIVLTMGTGNLGAPVISQNVVVKTVRTKAS